MIPKDPRKSTLSIVVPAFNECATIRHLLRAVIATPREKEIIVVDDCSTDGTREILQEMEGDWAAYLEVDDAEAIARTQFKFAFQPQNCGKGAALREGFHLVANDVVIVQDADLEYDPNEYENLLELIDEGDADVVYGSRFTGNRRRVLFFWHAVGNRMLTLLSNMMTNLNLTDMETCYKAFDADLLKRFEIRSNRFGVEPELTAKFAKMRARIYEVPISYRGRGYEAGKKIGWRDGISAVWTILKYRFIDDADNQLPGYTTLQRMASLKAYNVWLWEKLASGVGDSILEVGSGTGNVTQFLTNRESVVATDVSEQYIEMLTAIFANRPNVKVLRFDLGEDPSEAIRAVRYDTVVCLNVLEHIEDDLAALKRLHDLLEPGGRLLLVIPALEQLYGSIDRAIDHYRRYTKESVGRQLEASGFTIESARYFNTLGIVGWYLNSVILKRTTVPGLQARANSLLTPLLRIEDHFDPPWGMSLAIIAQKRD